jgi:hypothetical protein
VRAAASSRTSHFSKNRGRPYARSVASFEDGVTLKISVSALALWFHHPFKAKSAAASGEKKGQRMLAVKVNSHAPRIHVEAAKATSTSPQ